MPKLSAEEIRRIRQQNGLESAEPEAKTSSGMALLENFGRGASFGATPLINAGIQAVSRGFQDENPEPFMDRFSQELQYEGDKFNTYSSEHPVASMGGQIAGSIASSPAAGASLARNMGLAAVEGVNDATLMTRPGDTVGDFAARAGAGALGGAAGAGAASAIGSGVARASTSVGQRLLNAGKAGAQRLPEMNAGVNKAYGEAFGLRGDMVEEGGAVFRSRDALSGLPGKKGRLQAAGDVYRQGQAELADVYNKNSRIAEANAKAKAIFEREGASPAYNSARIERDVRGLEAGIDTFRQLKQGNDAYRFGLEGQRGVKQQKVGYSPFSAVAEGMLLGPQWSGARMIAGEVRDRMPSIKAVGKEMSYDVASRAYDIMQQAPELLGKAGKILNKAAGMGPAAFRQAAEELAANDPEFLALLQGGF